VNEYPYWLDTVDLRTPPLASVDLPGSADVVVVGGGYTGLSAARRLAKAGAAVVLVERGAIGSGASSRNGGQVLTGLAIDPAALVSRWGEGGARRLFDAASESLVHLESLIADESIDCEYARRGHLQAAWKPRHLDELRAEQALLARVFDHRVDIVPRAEQRAELGSDAYHGLLVDERSGSLNPARYVGGLAAAARRAGATLVAGVAVERIERQASGWRVSTARGVIGARDVLLATDGYTDGAAPALQRRLVPVGSYIVATEPLPPDLAATLLPRGRVAFDTKYFLYYFRLFERRLLFGGRAEFSRPTPASAHRAAAILRRGMIRVFPQLASVRIEYAWGGTVGFTRDRLPHAGRLDAAYYAGGYCGHGIAMATHLGDLVARRIAGERVDHPMFEMRFEAIPLYRGNPWFLPLVGAWYRVKDWLE
jgi:glycine/D-amino acid oxidase-like deaminating enzyme